MLNLLNHFQGDSVDFFISPRPSCNSSSPVCSHIGETISPQHSHTTDTRATATSRTFFFIAVVASLSRGT